MWNWDAGDEYSSFAACATSESFCRHLEAVDDEFLVACLDIGHAEMRGSGSGAANMIRALGSKLQALHIHDNDRHHDSHQIPFSMNIDFDAIIVALKEIRYSGWFTLECPDYLRPFDKDTVFTGVCHMADAVKKLAKMFDSLA
jgi:sugar phosphate isomerase/epimerase